MNKFDKSFNEFTKALSPHLKHYRSKKRSDMLKGFMKTMKEIVKENDPFDNIYGKVFTITEEWKVYEPIEIGPITYSLMNLQEKMSTENIINFFNELEDYLDFKPGAVLIMFNRGMMAWYNKKNVEHSIFDNIVNADKIKQKLESINTVEDFIEKINCPERLEGLDKI